ncbi:MAG: outer membrane beta-barrel protein [Acidobacteriota bacterium]
MWKAAWLLAIVLAPAAASAQSLFVQGGGGREIKRFSGSSDDRVFDAAASVVAVSAGGAITPHLTLSVELDLGSTSTTDRTTSVLVSGQVRDLRTRFTIRRRSASPLVAYQTAPHHAVQVACYVGISFSAVTREITSDAQPLALGTPQEATTFTDRVTGAIVGVDLAVHVAPHVALVPGLRAQGLDLSGDLNGHSIRTTLGARFSF